MSTQECLEAKAEGNARYYSLLGLAMLIKGLEKAAAIYFAKAEEFSPSEERQVFMKNIGGIASIVKASMNYINNLRKAFYNADPVNSVLYDSGILD